MNDVNADASTLATDIDPSKVLVVLPTLNEAKHIETCIRSLMAPADWVLQAKMVVADGGSTDDTRAIVQDLKSEFPNLSLVDNPGRLQSAGMNAAVAQAASEDCKYIVRCDVHSIYPHGYIKDVVSALASRDVASVATTMDATGPSAFQRAAAWIVDSPLGSGGSAHRGGTQSKFVDHGHHAGFDLKWFQSIGGYDASFSHNEDAEYDVRLGQAGGRIWLASDIRIQYVMRATLGSLAKQYWNYGAGRARTLMKHRIKPRLRQVVPALNLILLVLSVVLGLLHPLGLFWCGLYLALIAGTALAGAVSLRQVSGLFAGPALAAMHLGWGAGFILKLWSEWWQPTLHT